MSFCGFSNGWMSILRLPPFQKFGFSENVSVANHRNVCWFPVTKPGQRRLSSQTPAPGWALQNVFTNSICSETTFVFLSPDEVESSSRQF